jgi:hypothetical protein
MQMRGIVTATLFVCLLLLVGVYFLGYETAQLQCPAAPGGGIIGQKMEAHQRGRARAGRPGSGAGEA